ncbi:hypothetical protein BBB02_00400 [Wolbachia endosymbiont of Bemisia tabaci]|nr:hypothetical protein BBB02_00400 [Wolbachia endosymbiont of Bemisia tabaci]
MFGFKLHLIINEIGEGITLTKGSVNDRKPVLNLTKKLTAEIKKKELFDRGLKLITKVKKGITNFTQREDFIEKKVDY